MVTLKIKGITIHIGADVTALSKALSSIDKDLKNTGKSLKEIDKLFNNKNILGSDRAALAEQRQRELQKAIEDTRKKLSILNEAQIEAKKKLDANEIDQTDWDKLQREIVETRTKYSELIDTAGSGSGKLYDFAQNAHDWGEKLETLGQKLAPISAASLAIGGLAVKSAIGFETAWTGVTKTVDGTEEQMDELKQSIFELSKETASSAEDIAAVYEAAGQLGIDVSNIEEFAKNVIMLGDTTNITAADAATQLARFANITGLTADNYGRLGSTIVDLGNNYATTESEILDFAMRLAASGHQVGMSDQQIMGLATVLSSVGLEAQSSGTSISRVLSRIDREVGLAGKSIERIMEDEGISIEDATSKYEEQQDAINAWAEIAGMSGEEFKKAWSSDAYGVFQRIIRGMSDLTDEGENLNLILDDQDIKELRVLDTMKRLVSAVDLMEGAQITANQAWDDNTALVDEANKRYETTESKIQQAKAALYELGVVIGTELLPYIKDLADWAKDVIGRFSDMDQGTKDLILTILGVTAVASPALIATGKVVSGIGDIAEGLSKAKVKTGELGAKAGSLASIAPYAAIALGTAALVAGIALAVEEQTKYTDGVADMKKAHDEEIERIDERYDKADDLLNKIDDLMGIEDKSAQHKGELKSLIDEYNRTIGDTVLAYDAEKDSLIFNGEAIGDNTKIIRENMQARRDALKVEAYLNQAEEAMQKYVDTQFAMEETQERLAAKQERLNELNEKGNKLTFDERREKELLRLDIEELNRFIGDQEQALKDCNEEYYRASNMADIVSGAWQELKHQAWAAGVEIPKSLQTGLEEGRYIMPKTVDELNALIEFTQAEENATVSGKEIIENIRTQMLNGEIDIFTAAEMASDAVERGLDKAAEGAKAAGDKAVEQYTTAVEKGVFEGYKAGEDNADSVRKGLESKRQQIIDQGTEAEIGYVNALSRGEIDALVAANKIADSTIYGLSSGIDDAYDTGYNMIDGMSMGMYDAAWRLSATAAAAVNDALATARAAAEIKSPSKKWRRLVGYEMGHGAALGILDAMPLMEDAAERLTELGLETGQSILNNNPFSTGSGSIMATSMFNNDVNVANRIVVQIGNQEFDAYIVKTAEEGMNNSAVIAQRSGGRRV